MANLFDYLQWRGDIEFDRDPLNEIDATIFSFISYINLEKFTGRTLKKAARGFFSENDILKTKIGLLIPAEKTLGLFLAAAKSHRYASILFADCVIDINEKEKYQFCGETFVLPDKTIAVAFEGTDDTIVGWKEDFMLCYMNEIPSQKRAVEYLERIAAKYPEHKINLMGHSKGGNLAIYSAIKCSRSVQDRIVRIYNLDGPGFPEVSEIHGDYPAIEDRILTLIPQSSFIGVIFSQGRDFSVVRSRQRGVFQHDGFSWELRGKSFVKLSRLSAQGMKNDTEINYKLAQMTIDERRQFIEVFFGMLERTGAKTLSDISTASLRGFISIAREFQGLDKEQRELMIYIIRKTIETRAAKGKG